MVIIKKLNEPLPLFKAAPLKFTMLSPLLHPMNETPSKTRILIAEDEPDLRELTRIFLEGYGYKVMEASAADHAIRTSETFTGTIDLLLTDVIMPGMSGRQLAEEILKQRPETKIMYMTGYTDDMVVQHKVLEPGVQLLQKPFNRTELAFKVRSTLDGK